MSDQPNSWVIDASIKKNGDPPSHLGLVGVWRDLPLEHGLAPGDVVTDLVYAPLETGLLATARAAGCTVVDGLGMLLHQAVPGFERWFGQRPEVTEDTRLAVL